MLLVIAVTTCSVTSVGFGWECFRYCGCGSAISYVVSSAFWKISGNSFKSAPEEKSSSLPRVV